MSVEEQFRAFFETDKSPGKSRIWDSVNKFEKFGTVLNLNTMSDERPTHSERPRVCTEEVVDMVRESVEQSPKRSVRPKHQMATARSF